MSIRPLLILLFLVTGASADERLVSVYPEARLFTTGETSSLKLYRLAPKAEITVNGAAATLKELVPGQTVSVKTEGLLWSTKIAASGIGRAPAGNAPLPVLRSVTVQVRVDGSDRIFFDDGKLWVEHLTAKKPIDFVINGVEWAPTWKEMKSDTFTTFTVPVAPIGGGRVSLKQLSGRGQIRLIRSAAAAAVVTIEDGGSGDDAFAFQLFW